MAEEYETLTGPSWTGTVAAGNSTVLIIPGFFFRGEGAQIQHGVIVVGIPGSGGSVLVENSISSSAVVKSGNGNFNNWVHNTAIAQKQARIEGVITALRLTAIDQDAVFEVRM